MEHLDEKHLDKIKKDVLKSIDFARNSAKGLAEGVIDCDNMTQLTNVLTLTEEARSMTLILTKLFPGDTGIECLWSAATSVYDLGNKGKDRFEMQCKCENRKKRQ